MSASTPNAAMTSGSMVGRVRGKVPLRLATTDEPIAPANAAKRAERLGSSAIRASTYIATASPKPITHPSGVKETTVATTARPGQVGGKGAPPGGLYHQPRRHQQSGEGQDGRLESEQRPGPTDDGEHQSGDLAIRVDLSGQRP